MHPYHLNGVDKTQTLFLHRTHCTVRLDIDITPGRNAEMEAPRFCSGSLVQLAGGLFPACACVEELIQHGTCAGEDLWSLDPESKVWTEVETSGMWPSAVGRARLDRRWGRYGWTGAGSTLYLIGQLAVGDNVQLWAFSTTNSTWAQLAAGPSTRSQSCFGASGGLIYLLGGGQALGGEVTSVRSDFWSYDPAGNVWTERTDSVVVEGSNPWPRYGGALLDVAGELLLMYGRDTGIAPMLPRVPLTTVD